MGLLKQLRNTASEAVYRATTKAIPDREPVPINYNYHLIEKEHDPVGYLNKAYDMPNTKDKH